MFLRKTIDEEKETFKTPATPALRRDPVMFVSINTIIHKYNDKCYQNRSSMQGINWTATSQGGEVVFIVDINVKEMHGFLDIAYKPLDFYDIRVSFYDEETSASNRKQYYKLLFFLEGMDKYVVNVSTDAPGPGREMVFLTDMTWTENLADYLFIFPSLDDAGIKCETGIKCDDRFLLHTDKTFNGTLLMKLHVLINESENLNNYAVFLTDENQMDFRIYRLSSRPASARPDDIFWKSWKTILISVAGACLIAFATLLLVIRSRKVRSRRDDELIRFVLRHLSEADQQAASETAERRQSGGNDDLLEERISGIHEEIDEGRRLSNDYESILDEDVSGTILVNRKVSSSTHYQSDSLEHSRTWPRGASALSQKDKGLLNVSKSCGDLPNGKTDTLEHVYDKTATTEQEPEPFYSTLVRANSEMEEQPRLRWFMLKDSRDDGRYTGAFYSIEAEKPIELKDFSTREGCSTNTDCEGEYLTALDSNSEHEDYLELIAD
ncbi:hypothetical protein PoB_003911300 [Plakobranchus ocellatus]|uniref:CUB domain-containing protein n=1 Tax=Plakobranchus ocellatus TaxID=259542 RepID=A0AAV4AZ57_9GAST|nr:hypothetical protein PoB_003911300 [Plakobranchus ocellatus]